MLALALAALLADVVPLPRAHAHNDYAQTRPLHGAIERGFCSIEVDVFPVDEKLLVGHEKRELQPGRDIEALYLKPLSDILKRRRGRIYPEPTDLTLLVDFKEDAEECYRLLEKSLRPYRRALTRFSEGEIRPGAITVVVSGARPTETMAKQSERWAFVDGRPEDLERLDRPKSLMPLISASWPSLFAWRGVGPMPEGERAKLAQSVRSAHMSGQRLRFWATPESPLVWGVLIEAGVDLIGTDRQDELAAFLRAREAGVGGGTWQAASGKRLSGKRQVVCAIREEKRAG